MGHTVDLSALGCRLDHVVDRGPGQPDLEVVERHDRSVQRVVDAVGRQVDPADVGERGLRGSGGSISAASAW